MGVKGIRVLAAVVNQDGKSCLKLATQLKFHFFLGRSPEQEQEPPPKSIRRGCTKGSEKAELSKLARAKMVL